MLENSIVSAVEIQLNNAFGFRAQQRQNPVWRQSGQWSRKIKVITEFRAFGFFPGHDLGTQRAIAEKLLTNLTHQIRIKGEPIDQNRAGSIECRFRIGIAVDKKILRGCFWIHRGIIDQCVRQWLQASLTGLVSLGFPALFVRQVQIFQASLRITFGDLCAQLIGEFALLLDRTQDGFFARREFFQVIRTLLNMPQLGIIQRTGGFLAVTGDKRDGVSFREQRQRRLHAIAGNA